VALADAACGRVDGPVALAVPALCVVPAMVGMPALLAVPAAAAAAAAAAALTAHCRCFCFCCDSLDGPCVVFSSQWQTETGSGVWQ